MDTNTVRQLFYVIGIVATVYIIIRFVLPFLLALTGWILGIVITAVVFTALIAAIVYSIARLMDMLR
ncbi:MAG: hypothetical protein ACOC2H_00165 [Spirochaetota bacterium]